MLRFRAIAYPLRPFHVSSHHSPLQLVTRTVLPAGMVVMISWSVPGPPRRLTVAVTAAVLARPARTGARVVGACVAGPSCGVAFGTGSCPGAGGFCCACPGAITAAAATMLNAALSALKWKGMRKFSSPTTAPLLVAPGARASRRPHPTLPRLRGGRVGGRASGTPAIPGNGQETACKPHQHDRFAAEISIAVDAAASCTPSKQRDKFRASYRIIFIHIALLA